MSGIPFIDMDDMLGGPFYDPTYQDEPKPGPDGYPFLPPAPTIRRHRDDAYDTGLDMGNGYCAPPSRAMPPRKRR